MKQKENYKYFYVGIACYLLGVISIYLYYYNTDDVYIYRRSIEKHSLDSNAFTEAFYDKKGLREGVQKVYYKNGNLESLMNFKNGNPDGIFLEFYENGNIESISQNKDGKLNGKVYFFHLGNIISQEENYLEGLKNGEFTYYDSLGRLLEINTYDSSRLVYKWTKE